MGEEGENVIIKVNPFAASEYKYLCDGPRQFHGRCAGKVTAFNGGYHGKRLMGEVTVQYQLNGKDEHETLDIGDNRLIKVSNNRPDSIKMKKAQAVKSKTEEIVVLEESIKCGRDEVRRLRKQLAGLDQKLYGYNGKFKASVPQSEIQRIRQLIDDTSMHLQRSHMKLVEDEERLQRIVGSRTPVTGKLGKKEEIRRLHERRSHIPLKDFDQFAKSRSNPSTKDSTARKLKMEEVMNSLQAREGRIVHEMQQFGGTRTQEEQLQLEREAASIHEQIRALEAELAKSRSKPSTTD